MKKLDELTKAKLIYSGMLLVIGIVAITIGILQLVQIIEIKEWLINVFKFVPFLGLAYFIFDYVTLFTNKKKREKVCLVDKFSLIFIPPFSVTFAILLWCGNNYACNSPQLFIGPLIITLGVVYIFQAIYHWFRPLKDLLEDDDDSENKDNQEEVEKNS